MIRKLCSAAVAAFMLIGGSLPAQAVLASQGQAIGQSFPLYEPEGGTAYPTGQFATDFLDVLKNIPGKEAVDIETKHSQTAPVGGVGGVGGNVTETRSARDRIYNQAAGGAKLLLATPWSTLRLTHPVYDFMMWGDGFGLASDGTTNGLLVSGHGYVYYPQPVPPATTSTPVSKLVVLAIDPVRKAVVWTRILADIGTAWQVQPQWAHVTDVDGDGIDDVVIPYQRPLPSGASVTAINIYNIKTGAFKKQVRYAY